MIPAQVKSWWSNLGERDQYVLSIGVVVVTLYLLYQLIFAPLFHAVASKEEILVDKTETLSWMQKQTVPSNHHRLEGNLLAVFSEQLKKSSFVQFPYQLQQAGESRIQLTMNHVPYSDFLVWLRLLNETYSMMVVEMDIERTKTPGVVKLKLVVEGKESK